MASSIDIISMLQDCSIIIITLKLIINTIGDRHCYIVDGSLGTGGRRRRALQNEGICVNDFSKLQAAYDEYINDGYILNGIVVTHPDTDHYQGIQYLLETRRILCPVLLTNQFLNRRRIQAVNVFLNTLEATHNWNSTQHRPLNDIFPAWLNFDTVFSRLELYRIGIYQEEIQPILNGLHGNDNETSIITTICDPTARQQDILACLTGDANFTNQETTRDRFNNNTHIPLFLVPHHGSRNNSDFVFYRTVHIDVYLISCGTHRGYNFPHIEVLNAINRATCEAQRRAMIVLTNGKHLNNTKMSTRLSARIGHLQHDDEWRMWLTESITILYWDEHIYKDEDNDLITRPWLDYRLYPTPGWRFANNNLIQWSVNGYRTMALRYRDQLRKISAVREIETNQYLGVGDNNEVLLVHEQARMEMINGIPSPNSPCDWTQNKTFLLTNTLGNNGNPVFLQFSCFRRHQTNRSVIAHFLIFRCHQLPWLIQYAFVGGGTIQWSTTIYNGTVNAYRKNNEMALFTLED